MVESKTEKPLLSERFHQALALAMELHGYERRAVTEVPGLAHLLVVTGLVLEDGGDEDQAIAALLHDAVEDGGGRELLARIEQRFGSRVAQIVLLMSDTLEPSDEPWIARKLRFLEALEAVDDEATLRVALADKLSNARALVRAQRQHGDRIWQRTTQKTASQQLLYYRRLLELFERRRPGAMVEELRDAVQELAALLGSEGVPDPATAGAGAAPDQQPALGAAGPLEADAVPPPGPPAG